MYWLIDTSLCSHFPEIFLWLNLDVLRFDIMVTFCVAAGGGGVVVAVVRNSISKQVLNT